MQDERNWNYHASQETREVDAPAGTGWDLYNEALVVFSVIGGIAVFVFFVILALVA